MCIKNVKNIQFNYLIFKICNNTNNIDKTIYIYKVSWLLGWVTQPVQYLINIYLLFVYREYPKWSGTMCVCIYI